MRSKFVRPLVAFARRFPATSLVIVATSLVIAAALTALGFGDASPHPAAPGVSASPTPPVAGAVPSLGPRTADIGGGVPAVPTGEPASAATDTPADVRRRITDAEGALRTGQITAVDDLGGGIRIATTLRFDLGDGGHDPSVHVVGVYQGAVASQPLERIVIGARAWQRQLGGAWQEIGSHEEAYAQVRAFLPHVDAAPPDTPVESTGRTVTLRWYDAARDVEVAVEADPATGVLRHATERIRATGALLTISYDAWNTRVFIAPP